MSRPYMRPIPLSDPADVPGSHRLAGGPVRFAQIECLRRDRMPEVVAADALEPEELAPLISERAPLAGLSLSQPCLMGILNVTPDSFSDGGQHVDPEAAVARARAMVMEGARLIDVGGESTRPGAVEVSVDAEVARVVPVLRRLREAGLAATISLDTRKAHVAEAGLAAGADVINDVSGLRFDPDLARVTAEAQAPLIVMHSVGTPETMQAMANEAYGDVLLDVYDGLAASVAQAVAAGVPRDRIVVDPGIGFGKTLDQNLALLRRISLFHGLGCAILLGVSRKGMIGTIGEEPDAAARGPGSAALGLWAVSQGIQVLRVHDISLHRQALQLWRSVT